MGVGALPIHLVQSLGHPVDDKSDLADLIEAIVASHADAFDSAREQAAAAQRRGHPTFDLAVALPATAGGAAPNSWHCSTAMCR